MSAPPQESGKRRFRPGLWPTVIAVIGIVVLLALGVWQLERLAWKDAMIAEREASLAEVVALPESLPADPEALEPLVYRRTRLEGRFLNDRELHLGGRTFEGQVGFHIVTPLRLEDGREILVNRGWVTPSKREAASRPETLIEEPVAFEALLRRGGWGGRSFLRPSNDPAGNYWIYPDLPAMAEQAGLENPITGLYAEALEPTAAQAGQTPLPVPLRADIEVRNDHLEYALTWFALALALLVIYILFSLRPARPLGEDGRPDDEGKP